MMRSENYEFFVMTWDTNTGKVDASSNAPNDRIRFALTDFIEQLDKEEVFKENINA